MLFLADKVSNCEHPHLEIIEFNVGRMDEIVPKFCRCRKWMVPRFLSVACLLSGMVCDCVTNQYLLFPVLRSFPLYTA